MAFNMVQVGASEAEQEELLRGAGKSRNAKPAEGGGVVAAPIQERAIVIEAKTPSAYGATFPFAKGRKLQNVKR